MKSWSDEEVKSFVEKLKSGRRALWIKYIHEEHAGEGLGNEVRQWIFNSLYQSYPNHSLQEQTELLIRVRGVVRQELGLVWGWNCRN